MTEDSTEMTTVTVTVTQETTEPQALREMLGEPERRENDRHPDWWKVRAEHLKSHDFCICCGNKRKKDLWVHHIKSFKKFPELELDPKNLVTLCVSSDSGGMNCHLMMGHNGCWSESNDFVI